MKYGDIILFKPTGLVGKLISYFDGSPYSHGAIYLGKIAGQHLFIESHEKRRGVVIVRLEEWRKNYIVLRPNFLKKPKSKEEVLRLLNTKYDYSRLWWILKSKLFGSRVYNDDDTKLICTELCDNVWGYALGGGYTCTPKTIYDLYKNGKMKLIG